jgi:uncharacterized membrane protein
MDREQQENKSSRIYNQFRVTMDLGMGVFYLVIAGAIIIFKYYGTLALSNAMAYTFGGLMLAYGLFRIYRGVAGLRNRRRDIKSDFPDLYKRDSKNLI